LTRRRGDGVDQLAGTATTASAGDAIAMPQFAAYHCASPQLRGGPEPPRRDDQCPGRPFASVRSAARRSHGGAGAQRWPADCDSDPV